MSKNKDVNKDIINKKLEGVTKVFTLVAEGEPLSEDLQQEMSRILKDLGIKEIKGKQNVR
jgi:hypothetical protein